MIAGSSWPKNDIFQEARSAPPETTLRDILRMLGFSDVQIDYASLSDTEALQTD